MIIKGKCRGNGGQLANYLLSDKNDKAEILEITGTTNPNNLERSLVEMALSAIATKSNAGLYHAQISPDPKEPALDKEAWLKAVEILAKELGLEEQRRAVVLHEKDGRTHAHVVFERYQEGKGKNGQGILWSDDKNYSKHEKASREIEQVLGHERTPQKSDVKENQNRSNLDVKKELTELWHKHEDPETFIAEAKKLGYTIAQGEDRRPFKVLTPEGKNLDLVRQLEKVKTKDVAERLNPIRNTLQTEKEALQERESQAQVKEPEKKEQAPPLALKWDLGTVQKIEPPKPKPPANDNKIESLHKLGQFKANEKATENKPPTIAEAKLKEMDANKAKILQDIERTKQLTAEERQAEHKKKVEQRLKEMQEQREQALRDLRL